MDDTERFDRTLEHNGLLYDCFLRKVSLRQSDTTGTISVSVPAEQVTSELYEIVRGEDYLLNINTPDTRYEIDSVPVNYTRRGETMTFVFEGDIWQFDAYSQ